MTLKQANNVLLIEDNSADIESVRRGLARIDYEIELKVISEGLAAREFIVGETDRNYAADVDLVLLDLNLPGIGGRELLDLLNSEEPWQSVPVVVFTTSNNEEDIKKAYQKGANSYLIKPNNITEFLEMIDSVCFYWLQVIGENTPTKD